MYRKCATEHSAQNQRTLENAFLDLMGQTAYEQITVTRICEEAGLSRRIFYHLFDNKRDVLHALIDHRILDLEGYRTDLPDMALRLFYYWRSQKPLLDALTRNQLGSLLLERMVLSILQEDYDVWRWLQAEDIRNRNDILAFNISGIMGLIFRWYHSGFEKSPEQMAELIRQLMQNPLVKHNS